MTGDGGRTKCSLYLPGQGCGTSGLIWQGEGWGEGMQLLTRRQLLFGTGAPYIPCYAHCAVPETQRGGRPMIQTVTGSIQASDLGMTLPHEHVMCDFVGAEKTSPDRWNRNEVVEKALPYLLQIKERGVKGFMDCTPAYIGRDPIVLKRLAQRTGLHIVTNTGYYGAANDKYLPKHAFEESAEQLADRWCAEWKGGIDGTGVKP